MLAPATKIKTPPWAEWPETKAVIAALQEGRADTAALFVGGCVRNTLMGIPVTDIDIATVLKPEEAMAALQKAGIKAIPTGVEHGTVTAVKGQKSFEITTLRRDVETDGRRAVVAFTGDWTEDAQRRDFTMNTLLADGEGNIYDPLGQGLKDLRARRVVFVGDPSERIAEDYLRILRFFRFHAVYGAGEPDPAALFACRAAAGKVRALSRERITQEFLRLLASDDPAPVLQIMFQNMVLDDIAAAGYDEVILSVLSALQKTYEAEDVVARLVVLSAFMASHMEVFEKYLVLSNAQKKKFETMLEAVFSIDDMSESSIKRLIYKFGNDITTQSVALFRAWQEEEDEALIAFARDWQAPAFPLSGEDVKSAGITEGPAIGEILSEIESWWLENDLTPDRIACLEKLKTLL